MGITRYTAMAIQGWPVTDDANSEGLWPCGVESIDSKGWASVLWLVKRGEPHCILLSTKPIYSSESEAVDTLKATIAEVKALDLDDANLFAPPSPEPEDPAVYDGGAVGEGSA